jgi:uncharacterized delta-60 repeat protein
LDAEFGVDGRATTFIGPDYEYANAVMIQPDGKIVVVGYSFLEGTDCIVILRYLGDGSLDPSFDGDGIATTNLGLVTHGPPSSDYAYAADLQTDGKLVVLGITSLALGQNPVIFRYNADGSLDVAFDGDGMATSTAGLGGDGWAALAIQSDGKIVAAGNRRKQNNSDMAVLRFNANGSIDTGFGTDGIVTIAVGPRNETACAVGIQGDGKIIVAGYSDISADYSNIAVVRLSTNGSLDPTFGEGGKITTDIDTEDWGNALAIQADGRIVVAGYTQNDAGRDIVVARYMP